VSKHSIIYYNVDVCGPMLTYLCTVFSFDLLCVQNLLMYLFRFKFHVTRYKCWQACGIILRPAMIHPLCHNRIRRCLCCVASVARKTSINWEKSAVDTYTTWRIAMFTWRWPSINLSDNLCEIASLSVSHPIIVLLLLCRCWCCWCWRRYVGDFPVTTVQ